MVRQPAEAGGDPCPRARPTAGRRPDRDGERCDLCGRACQGGPPPPAPARGAPDRLRVRAVLGHARPATPSTARWARAPPGCPTSSSPTSAGPASGSRSASRSSCARRVVGGMVGLYPSPAGATECELDLSAWDALRADNPVLESLEADAEGLIVNRLSSPPQHAIAPIDDCYRLVGLVKASWEGISGGTGLELALQGFFDELRERGRPRERGGRHGAPARARRAGAAGAALRDPRRRGGAPRGGAHAGLHRARDRDLGPRGLHRGAHRPDHDRAGQALYDDATARAPGRDVRRRPSAGRPRPTPSSGPSSACSCPPSRAPPRSACRWPCTYDLELAAAKYIHSMPDGEVPLLFNFTGTIFYRGDGGPDADREGALGLLGALSRCPWPPGRR